MDGCELYKKSASVIAGKRKFTLTRAAAVSSVLLLLGLLAAVQVDMALHLSGGVRWAVLISCVIVPFAIALKIFLPVLSYGRSQAIRDLERHNPQVGQALRTFEQISNEDNTPAHVISDLKKHVDEVAAPLNPSGLIPWKSLRLLTLVLSALIVLVSFLAVNNVAFSIALQRWLSPSSIIPFSEFTELRAPNTFKAGENPQISSKITGQMPDSVELVLMIDGSEKERIVSLKPQNSGVCAYTVKGEKSSFSFFFRRGEIESVQQRVVFMPAPAINKIEIAVLYPAYTGMGTKNQQIPDVSALSESMVGWKINMNVSMKTAVLKVTEGPSVEMNVEGTLLEGSHKIATGSTSYHIEGISVDGQQFKSKTYDLLAFEDSLPQVRFVTPQNNIKVTSVTEIPLKIRATDDFGIREMGVGIYLNEDPEKFVVKKSFDKMPDSKEMESTLLLEDLDVDINSNLNIFAYVRDNKNEIRVVSELLVIDIKPYDSRTKMDGGDNDEPPPSC